MEGAGKPAMKGSAATAHSPSEPMLQKLLPKVKHTTFTSDEAFYAAYAAPEIQKLPIEERLPALFKLPGPTVLYDSNRPLYHLFNLQGWAVMLCLQRLEFWLLLALSAVLSAVYFANRGFTTANNMPAAAGWPKAAVTLLAIPTALISFLMVFFLNSAYGRYVSQYQACYRMLDGLSRLRLLFRVHFGDAAFPGARAVRHSLLKLLCAGQALAYAGLPQKRSARMHLWTYEYIREKGLLSDDQLEQVKPLMGMADGRFAMMEVFQWVCCTFWECLGRGQLDLDPTCMNQITTHVCAARQSLEFLYATTAAPIPFVYLNLMSVYVAVYLAMLSYLFVFFDGPYYGHLSYAIILLAFLSLRELGCVLSDPLGEDPGDIPVFNFVFEFDRETERLADVQPFGRETTPAVLSLADDDYMQLLARQAVL